MRRLRKAAWLVCIHTRFPVISVKEAISRIVLVGEMKTNLTMIILIPGNTNNPHPQEISYNGAAQIFRNPGAFRCLRPQSPLTKQVVSQPRSQGSLLPAPLRRLGENPGNDVGSFPALCNNNNNNKNTFSLRSTGVYRERPTYLNRLLLES